MNQLAARLTFDRSFASLRTTKSLTSLIPEKPS
jgi:hypothetical protein